MRGIEWSIEAAAVPAILLLKENPPSSVLHSFTHPFLLPPILFSSSRIPPPSVGRSFLDLSLNGLLTRS